MGSLFRFAACIVSLVHFFILVVEFSIMGINEKINAMGKMHLSKDVLIYL